MFGQRLTQRALMLGVATEFIEGGAEFLAS